jgi:hypothetical protein
MAWQQANVSAQSSARPSFLTGEFVLTRGPIPGTLAQCWLPVSDVLSLTYSPCITGAGDFLAMPVVGSAAFGRVESRSLMCS